jgi:hypothetical protein
VAALEIRVEGLKPGAPHPIDAPLVEKLRTIVSQEAPLLRAVAAIQDHVTRLGKLSTLPTRIAEELRNWRLGSGELGMLSEDGQSTVRNVLARVADRIEEMGKL